MQDLHTKLQVKKEGRIMVAADEPAVGRNLRRKAEAFFSRPLPTHVEIFGTKKSKGGGKGYLRDEEC